MSIQTLKVYKTEKAKRGTNLTSEFKLFDSDIVNDRVRVIDSDGEIHWVSSAGWITAPTEKIYEPEVAPKEVVHHTVKWGENVEQIARKYGVDCGLLYARYPNKLAAGMTITIVK